MERIKSRLFLVKLYYLIYQVINSQSFNWFSGKQNTAGSTQLFSVFLLFWRSSISNSLCHQKSL